MSSFMTPATPSVFLVRHGQTDWALSGRHTSRTERPLTAAGEAEADALRVRLEGMPFARVLTSPRLRARQTCDRVGFGPVAEIVPDLAEWDYGELEGLTATEIRRAHPGWDLYRDGCPGGESPAEVAARADRVVTVLRATGDRTAVFSHGHMLCVLAVRWIGMPVETARHLALDTASLSTLTVHSDRGPAPVIAMWNEKSRAPGATAELPRSTP